MGSFWTAPLKFTTTVRNGSSTPLPPCMALSPAAEFFCSTWIVSCTQGGATRASGVRTCMLYLQQVFLLVPCGERRVLSGTSTYSTLFTTSRPAKASNFASEITEMPETPPRKKKVYGSTNQTIRTRDSGVESAVFYDVVPETLRWCVNSDLNFAPRQVSVVDRWVRIYLSLVRFKHGGYEIDEMWGLCFLVCVLSSGQETNTNNIIVFISS